ncbi:MAG: hypothetical protein FWH31_03990 [Streptococcaceae bacterium]|nr:hypothetical protein [Streptococcaceae bacterium]
MGEKESPTNEVITSNLAFYRIVKSPSKYKINFVNLTKFFRPQNQYIRPKSLVKSTKIDKMNLSNQKEERDEDF